MGPEITAETFIREYTRELHNKNAAVFAGAGLSMASGYVDWKALLKEIIEDLRLDPEREHDLVTLAQYHCNQAGGNRVKLTQTIVNHFAQTKSPTANHRILARLPIFTYWTTNYDKLIETALTDAKKVADVKYAMKQLSVTRPERDVTVYKMHGDVDHAADAVVTKDDYESYPLKMSPFMSALRGDLVAKTFLFLGFSFTDPNIDYILSRVRAQYEQHQRQHYCIQKRVSGRKGQTDEELEYEQRKQAYFVRDLMRFGIYTVLVDDYADITKILERIAARYRRSSVFISGAVEEYGTWTREKTEAFLHNLSHDLASKKNRIITGFGTGVGSAVINGVLAYLNDVGKTISDEDLVMRPFPQVATGSSNLATQWTAYRKGMIEHGGIALFVFGNKTQDAKIVPSNGMRQEFELCLEAGVQPIPVGATGYMARELWDEVIKDFDIYFPGAATGLRADFELLGDATKTPEELSEVIRRIIEHLQRS